MSNIIETRAVISATDKTSGVLKKVAAQFKDIAGSAKALEGVKPIKNLQLDDAFFSKMKMTAKQIDAVKKSYSDFQTALKSGGPVRASTMFGAIEMWSQKTRSTLRQVRDDMEATEKRQARLFKGSAGAARLAAGAVGFGGAAYMANRGVRSAIGAGANMVRENARDYLAGLSDSDTDRLKRGAMDLSSKYNSVDAATLHERLRDAAMSMRSVDKALELGDTLARGHVVMQSLVGKEQAVEQGRKLFKGLDTLNKNQNPDEVRELYDAFIRAQGVEGNDMNLGDIFKVAKMGKSGATTLDNRFLMATAPGLMQDMGPDRLGTALGSSMSQVIGGRATKASMGVQQEYGLRDAKGKFRNSREIMSNPFDYTMNRLIPALQKKGVNVDDNVAVTAATSKLFSSQMVADMFNKMITQREQYKAKDEQYRKAPGLDAAKQLPGRDPFVAAEGFVSQLRNMAASLAEPVFPAATKALSSMSSTLGEMAKNFSESTPLDKFGKAVVGGVGGTAAAAGGVMAAKSMYQWFTGTGALNGSAALLSKSAAELTGAAAALARSSVAPAAVNGATSTAAAAAGAGGASIWSRGTSAVMGALPYAAPVALGAGAYWLAESANEAQGITRESTRERQRKQAAKYNWWGKYDPEGAPSRVNAIRQSGTSSPMALPQPSAEPVRAEIEGNATLTGQITVAPSAFFMTTIDQKIDNKINAFKATNITGRGSSGSTGRSAPDASPAP